MNNSISARIIEIENLVAQKIIVGETRSKKEVEEVARSFKPLKNKIDGRIAEIPNNTIGKICGHQGYDISRIIEHFPILFETSLFGWSKPEIQHEGHKTHPNIKAYHNYVNKFTDGTGEYYIRFTLHEEKVKPRRKGKNYIHSTAVSNIHMYKNKTATGSIVSGIIDPGEANSTPPFIDSRLAEFFNSVKMNKETKK